jgi:hypothetical protein
VKTLRSVLATIIGQPARVRYGTDGQGLGNWWLTGAGLPGFPGVPA